MNVDPTKIDLDEMRSYQKSEGGNMKSDLEASKNDHSKNKNAENINNNETVNPSITSTPVSKNSEQKATRLPSATKLLSDAWRLYKSRWKTFLGIMIVPILLTFVIFAIFAVGALIMGILGSLIPQSAIGNIIIFAISFIALVILFLAIIIIQFWSQAALIYAIKDSAENIGIKESYKRGRDKIRSFFWVSILSSFIIMGGYIFFIIPGIIFAIWFSLALYIIIAEDLKGMNALLKSREYIRNYWWSVLWRFFVMGLFVYLIIIIFGIFIFIIASLSGITLDLNSDSFEMMINLLINIPSFILAPLVVIYPFLIYKNLKEIKGDFGFKPSKKSKRLFIATGVLGILLMMVVVAGMVFAFSTIFSSLDNTNDRAMDIARRSDMAQIKIALIIYYDEQERYPNSLDKLSNIKYTDPRTNEPYEYHQLNNGNDYEICVLFGKGRECFYSEDHNSWNNKTDDESEKIDNMIIREKDSRRILDLGVISTMLEYCKTKTGGYPLSHTNSKLNEDNNVVNEIQFANDNFSIPLDPKDPEYYYGYKSLDRESFELTARLENMDDPRCDLEIKEDEKICIYKLRK